MIELVEYFVTKKIPAKLQSIKITQIELEKVNSTTHILHA